MKKTILFLFFLVFSLTIWSQVRKNSDVDINLLMNETQLTTNDPDMVNLIWWIPKEYWEIAFSEDPTITENQIGEMMQIMSDYNVCAIVQGRMGLFGGVTYETAEDLFKKTSMKDHYGDSHSPLERSDISADMNNFLDIMKPIVANMLGNMGENFVFLVFDSKNSSNKLVVDSYKDHDFEIVLEGNESYKFDLPFSALLEPKTCPKDNEKLNGKWNYCPYHGEALNEQKAK